jgi:hypothetical protein
VDDFDPQTFDPLPCSFRQYLQQFEDFLPQFLYLDVQTTLIATNNDEQD